MNRRRKTHFIIATALAFAASGAVVGCGNGTATITRSGLTRSGGCCRPTGGSVTVNRTGGIAPGQHDWSFGPSCGTVTRDGTTATMPECL
jgi:hypothetical protein